MLGLDPAVYFTEPDAGRNAVRDAAATVITQVREYQAEQQRQQQLKRR